MNKPTEIRFTDGIPHDVIEKIFLEEMSPTRAWREYLGLSQQEAAHQAGMELIDYIEHEELRKLRKPARVKIAAALGIAPDLLDICGGMRR